MLLVLLIEAIDNLHICPLSQSTVAPLRLQPLLSHQCSRAENVARRLNLYLKHHKRRWSSGTVLIFIGQVVHYAIKSYWETDSARFTRCWFTSIHCERFNRIEFRTTALPSCTTHCIQRVPTIHKLSFMPCSDHPTLSEINKRIWRSVSKISLTGTPW